MTKALIFDFDGLIVDTEQPEYQSWAEIYEEYGCFLPLELWTSHIGMASDAIPFNPYDHLERQLGSPIDRDEIRARRRARYFQLVNAQPILPGVEEYIADAQRLNLKLAVASSSRREWVEGNLNRLGLRAHFDCALSFDDVERGKPDPAVYLAALARLDVPATRTLALEDSPNGVWAARRAEIYCVAVPNPLTRTLSLEHADRLLTSLADVPLPRLLVEATHREG